MSLLELAWRWSTQKGPRSGGICKPRASRNQFARSRMHLFAAVPRVPFSPTSEKLRNALRPARVVPPHGWNLVGAAKHL
jgi:hypothetical protein